MICIRDVEDTDEREERPAVVNQQSEVKQLYSEESIDDGGFCSLVKHDEEEINANKSNLTTGGINTNANAASAVVSIDDEVMNCAQSDDLKDSLNTLNSSATPISFLNAASRQIRDFSKHVFRQNATTSASLSLLPDEELEDVCDEELLTEKLVIKDRREGEEKVEEGCRKPTDNSTNIITTTNEKHCDDDITVDQKPQGRRQGSGSGAIVVNQLGSGVDALSGNFSTNTPDTAGEKGQ